MAMKKKKAPKKKITGATKWAYDYKKFQLPTFRSPLEEDTEVRFYDEVDHAYFLRCCELYRVLDLLERKVDDLIDTYSKYRSRTQFTEVLTFRYFDSEEALVAKFDPKLAASMFFLFNFLYEMRISLTYTDALPLTVKKDIDDGLWTLRQGWNSLRDEVEQKYSWKFKKLQIPEIA
ncbi:MAG: hypothetical protein M9962_15225 [Oligoflexia bacterium]|nr:hypothetical protein [Oligoflexia bacterium]